MNRKHTGYYLLLAFFMLMFAGRAMAREQEKELTLLIYMTGSDLESEYGAATSDLNEMKNAGLDDKNVNVVVLAAGTKAWQMDRIRADRKNTLLVSGNTVSVLKQERLTNMGAEETLSDFIQYGVEQFPAKQYGLIFWDHGGGAVEGVCLDSWYGDCLTMDEIDRGLRNGLREKKLSFVGFDACLMATVEVADTVSPYASYLVASEELEPGGGWDYTFLGEWKDSSREENEMVKQIAAYYYDAYPDTEERSISVIDLSCMEQVSLEVERYFASLKKVLEEKDSVEKLAKIRSELFEFGYINSYFTSSNMVDLKEFVTKTGQAFSVDSSMLLQSLSEAVIQNKSNIGAAGGLSVFYPYRGNNKIAAWMERYENLTFYPNYTDFLYSFHSAINEKVALNVENRISWSTKDPVSIQANPKLLGQIEQIYRMQWQQTGTEDGRYLRIGSRSGIAADKNGCMLPEFDGKWFSWQGRLLPIEAFGNDYGEHTFPALLNGERVRIVAENDADGFPVKILGAMPDYDSAMPARGMKPIKKGDMVQISYVTNIFQEGLEFPEDSDEEDGTLYYGEAFLVETDTILFGDMDPGTYLYGYGFLDYAQNLYLSDFIEVTLEQTGQ